MDSVCGSMGWPQDRAQGKDWMGGKQKQKCVCGQQNGSQEHFRRSVFIKKKEGKTCRQSGMDIFLRKKNICKENYLAGNTPKCAWWLSLDVDDEYFHLFVFLYCLHFTK